MELNIYELLILSAQIFAAGAFYGRLKKEVRNRWYNLLWVASIVCFGIIYYIIAVGVLILRKLKSK